LPSWNLVLGRCYRSARLLSEGRKKQEQEPPVHSTRAPEQIADWSAEIRKPYRAINPRVAVTNPRTVRLGAAAQVEVNVPTKVPEGQARKHDIWCLRCKNPF